ncbi:MAG: DnaB-like helicase N-terminal domain-containing protein [Christensenellales bacterium]
MASLHLDGQPVDLVTVLEKMNQQGTLESAGGMEYLTTLSNLYRRRPMFRSISRSWRTTACCAASSTPAAIWWPAATRRRKAQTTWWRTRMTPYALAMRNRTDSLETLEGGRGGGAGTRGRGSAARRRHRRNAQRLCRSG